MKRFLMHREPADRAVGRRGLKVATVVAALPLAILAGCSTVGSGTTASTGATDQKPVTLSLWDTDTRPERTASLEKLISMFETENPNIKITYLGLPTDSYMQKISTAIATNSTPDLLTPKASDLSALVAQNALAPLDARFNAGGWASKIDKSMVASTKAAAPDRKLYMTPTTALADVIYYRKDWFKQAGLKAPTTWADFYAAAKKLTDPSTGKFGYTIRGGAGFFPQFAEMVYTEAGISSFFDKKGVSTLDDPAIIKNAQKYVDLYKKMTAESDLTADFKAMVAEFGAGSAAMLSHSIGSYPTLLPTLGADAIGTVIPFPAANGTQVLSGRMTTGFAMFKKSKNQDAAWKFLQFVMDKKGNSFWAQASGYIPGNLAVEKSAWVKANPAIADAVAASKNPKAVTLNQPYYLPEFNTITGTEMLPDWQLVLQDKLSVKAFLTKYADELTAAQKRYTAATGK